MQELWLRVVRLVQPKPGAAGAQLSTPGAGVFGNKVNKGRAQTRGGHGEGDAWAEPYLMLEFPWTFFFYSMLFSYKEKLFLFLAYLSPQTFFFLNFFN